MERFIVARLFLNEVVYIGKRPPNLMISWTSNIREALRFSDMSTLERFRDDILTLPIWGILGCRVTTYNTALVVETMES